MKTLKQLRVESGLSQSELGQKMAKDSKAVFQGPVSNLEKGKVSPTVRRLAETLHAMGFNLELIAVRGDVREVLEVESLLGRNALSRAALARTESEP